MEGGTEVVEELPLKMIGGTVSVLAFLNAVYSLAMMAYCALQLFRNRSQDQHSLANVVAALVLNRPGSIAEEMRPYLRRFRVFAGAAALSVVVMNVFELAMDGKLAGLVREFVG